MDRRTFITNLSAIPFTDELIKERQNSNTIDMQIIMIKALWELSQKIKSMMFCYLPFGYWDVANNEWCGVVRLPVLGVYDKTINIGMIEESSDLSERFDWLDMNIIEFKKLPEVINFQGVMWPIVEIFRLELPKK